MMEEQMYLNTPDNGGCGHEYLKKSLMDSFAENESDTDSNDDSYDENEENDPNDNSQGSPFELRLGRLYKGVEKMAQDTYKLFHFPHCGVPSEVTVPKERNEHLQPPSMLPSEITLSRQRSALSNIGMSSDIASILTRSELGLSKDFDDDFVDFLEDIENKPKNISVFLEKANEDFITHFGLETGSSEELIDASNSVVALPTPITETTMTKAVANDTLATEATIPLTPVKVQRHNQDASILDAVSNEPTLLGRAKEVGEGLLLRTRSSPQPTTLLEKAESLKRTMSFDSADLMKVAVAMNRLTSRSTTQVSKEPVKYVKEEKKTKKTKKRPETTDATPISKILSSITEEDCDYSSKDTTPEKPANLPTAIYLSSKPSKNAAERMPKLRIGDAIAKRSPRRMDSCTKRDEQTGFLTRFRKQLAMPLVESLRHHDVIDGEQSSRQEHPQQKRGFNIFARRTKAPTKSTQKEEIILFGDDAEEETPPPTEVYPKSISADRDCFEVNTLDSLLNTLREHTSEMKATNCADKENEPTRVEVANEKTSKKSTSLGQERGNQIVQVNKRQNKKPRTKSTKPKSEKPVTEKARKGERVADNSKSTPTKNGEKGRKKNFKLQVRPILFSKKGKCTQKIVDDTLVAKTEPPLIPTELETTNTEETCLISSFDVLRSHSSRSLSFRGDFNQTAPSSLPMFRATPYAPNKSLGQRPDPEGRLITGRLIPLEEC